jgi:hypothetical protein
MQNIGSRLQQSKLLRGFMQSIIGKFICASAQGMATNRYKYSGGYIVGQYQFPIDYGSKTPFSVLWVHA